MSKHFVIFAAIALSLVHAVAFGSESRNLEPNAPHTSGVSESHSIRIPSQEISIYFENNIATPRWEYADNAKAYDAIAKTIEELSSKQSEINIIITGAASPVGSESYNFRLALQRANAIRDIISRMNGGDKLQIRTVSAGENWTEFHSYIDKMYHEPNREKVLAILRTKISNDEKERQLQALDNGRTWRKLVREYMASSRSAAVIHFVEINDLAAKAPSIEFQPTVLPIEAITPFAKPDFTPYTPPVAIEQNKEIVQSITQRKPVVAVRSNLLVPALNIGIEVPIGTHWSVGADYYFPWVWPKRDNKNCFEFLGWGVEGRYWFGKNRTLFDRLQGHSVGLYGYMGYYDFERNFHGHQGEFVNVGLDYTYAMAVGKKKSIHFEFSLGVGYIYSQARKYTVIEEKGPLISDKITKNVGYFGPTKANISLVVPIFQKVKPNDRGRGNE